MCDGDVFLLGHVENFIAHLAYIFDKPCLALPRRAGPRIVMSHDSPPWGRESCFAQTQVYPICRLHPLDAVLSSGLCGLTSRDRLNSSENYLLLGFPLAMPLQTVLLLVR